MFKKIMCIYILYIIYGITSLFIYIYVYIYIYYYIYIINHNYIDMYHV